MPADAALAATTLLMGLAGAPHCAAMCGAACGGIARRCGGAQRMRQASVALHLGRIASYALAGALLAAGVGSLGRLAEAAPVLRPFWAMLHVALIVLGGWLLWRGEAPAWLGARLRPTGMRAGKPWHAALIGAGWAVLPCGLLQSALIVASFASGPWEGAAVMATFALATGVSLGLAPWLWARLQRAGWQGAGAVRLAGVVLVGSSGYALAHGLQLAIAGLCATPG